ncbi:hypothetical protein BKA69DRAFT_1064188 [Paraphysoderma sedebokerense]|nr:hypothetical protein BKA69DRAFT_1064188 [Paraphysoderma sedebokerense]
MNNDNISSQSNEVLETAKRRLKRGKCNRKQAPEERHDGANACTLNESILTLASPNSSGAQQTNIVVQSSILFSSVTDNASTSVCSKSPQKPSLDPKQKLERSWAIDQGPPITIENIYDDQLPDDFTYISNLVFHNSVQPPSPEFLTGCQCDGNCELVQLPPEENENDGIVSTCKCVTMGAGHGEPPYDEDGLVRLEPGYTIYECNALCHCDENCPNKVVQRGRQFELQVFKCFGKKGWGVKTLEFIPARSFVCEYVGEVISHDECEKRGYEGHGTYAFAMDIARGDENLAENNIVYTIDAARKGNVARFINHSCDPNLSQYAVFIESNDVQFHRVGFFAKRDIHPGEELSFDYSGPNQAKRKNKGRAKKRKKTVIMQDEMACLCGSEFCRGTIKL